MLRVLLLSLFLTWGLLQAAEAMTSSTHQDNWDLSDLYPSQAAWQAEYERVTAAAEQLGRYQGTLNRSATSLYTALDAISRVTREYHRLEVYASLLADEDLRAAVNQEHVQMASALGTRINEQTAWLAPEILAMGCDKVRGFVSENLLLREHFDLFLEDTLRAGSHTLGPEAEAVLAAAGNVLQQPVALHSQLTNAEMSFPSVTLSTGEQIQLSAGNYEKYRQLNNRDDRKLVFDAFWGGWKQFESTLGASLTTQLMGNVFTAHARKFDGALSAALFPDNMPVTVYRTLVKETNAALPTLHRYLRLRKQVLGIKDDLQYFDNYASMFPLAQEPVFTLEDSRRITLAALTLLGDDYLCSLRKGFDGQWMSVYPAAGKRTGAYMNGSAYDVHPYLLLNHNDDYQALSTFAHEWGHAAHTMLANQSQPYEKSNYSTFIAESASIGNEMLLSDYLIAHAGNKQEKLYYLGAAVEEIRQTYFRQVMFAEFELAAHEELERGRPLSGQRLSDMYCSLLRKYYGEAEGVMKIDPAYCIEWAYIPHLYYNFYLYQYATSMAGAAYLTEQIQIKGAPARDRYLQLLRAGGSDYPYDLYKHAGLDMASGVAYQALMARMNRLLDEIEALSM